MLVNSAIFSDELFDATEARAAEVLSPGALVVTLRRGFADCGHEGACWELLEATERRQSWGMSTVYVHRRTQNSPAPRRHRGLAKLPPGEARARVVGVRCVRVNYKTSMYRILPPHTPSRCSEDD